MMREGLGRVESECGGIWAFVRGHWERVQRCWKTEREGMMMGSRRRGEDRGGARG
jgi:hypothetical protein